MLDRYKTSCLFPQHRLTRLAGWLANSKISWIKNTFISWFIKKYQVDMSEAINSDPHSYACFNDFFTRQLKTGARIIDNTPDAIISPADGFISQYGDIQQHQLLQAKGSNYSLTDLLTDKKLSHIFQNGRFMTTYLSPKDYHRVHMPVSGKLIKTIYVPGKLFPVFPYSVKTVNNLFARNERLICLFETKTGPMALILVGATIVAGIATVWNQRQAIIRSKSIISKDWSSANIMLQKGEEMGHFQLGSTTIILFAENTIQWLERLQPQQSVQMGQLMGTEL